MDFVFYDSPLGTLRVGATQAGVSALLFAAEKGKTETKNQHLQHCLSQLDLYFSKGLQTFHLPLDVQGTDFQRKVWNQLLEIPFGKTITYLELAKKLGDPKSIRAAAHANGQNPIPIIIPCHRVIGSDGSLTGYAGGLWRKQWLLEHEQEEKQGQLF